VRSRSENGRPIAFESRKLSPTETRYTTTEQELLAVVHAMRTLRCYLEGCVNCTVVTDHRPLTFFDTQPNLSRRQARWSEYLSRFRFKWVYRPGRINVADPLSRNPGGVALATVMVARTRAAAATAGAAAVPTNEDCPNTTRAPVTSSDGLPTFYARIRAGTSWMRGFRTHVTLLRCGVKRDFGGKRMPWPCRMYQVSVKTS